MKEERTKSRKKPELGCKDELGRCVIEIYSEGGKWVVYRNDKNVRLWTDQDAGLASEAVAQIGVDLAKVESNMYFFEERARQTSKTRERKQRWELQRQSVYSLVARSITLRLTKHAKQAAIVMELAESMLSKFIWRANIGGYLLGATAATVTFLVVALMTGECALLEGFRGVFVFSALGGFLSVMGGIRQLQPALRGQRYLNIVSGVIRMLIAVISGALMYVAVKGGILPLVGSADGGDESQYGLWFLLAAAGFVEKLVPDILSRDVRGGGVQ